MSPETAKNFALTKFHRCPDAHRRQTPVHPVTPLVTNRRRIQSGDQSLNDGVAERIRHVDRRRRRRFAERDDGVTFVGDGFVVALIADGGLVAHRLHGDVMGGEPVMTRAHASLHEPLQNTFVTTDKAKCYIRYNLRTNIIVSDNSLY